MKKFKGLLRLILLMIAGGIFGFLVAIGTSKGQESEVYSTLIDFMTKLSEYHIWFQIFFPLILICIAILLYIRSKKLYQNHLPIEEKEDKIDRYLDWALSLTTVAYGLSFVLFGVGLSYVENVILLVGIFITSILIVLFMEVAIVTFVQKMDPSKKGDPTSADFSKHWEASLDEAEKYLLYKSAYKSFMFMKNFLLALMVIAMLGEVLFDTGKFALILTGLAWVVQSLSFSKSARKASGKNYSN